MINNFKKTNYIKAIEEVYHAFEHKSRIVSTFDAKSNLMNNLKLNNEDNVICIDNVSINLYLKILTWKFYNKRKLFKLTDASAVKNNNMIKIIEQYELHVDRDLHLKAKKTNRVINNAMAKQCNDVVEELLTTENNESGINKYLLLLLKFFIHIILEIIVNIICENIISSLPMSN